MNLSSDWAKAIHAGIIKHYNTELAPGAFDVMLVLIVGAGADGIYDRGPLYIQRRTGFSRSKVMNCLFHLDTTGYIKRVRRSSRLGAVAYRIVRTDA